MENIADPKQVDAGKFIIDNFDTPRLTRREIRISEDSYSLQLPVSSVRDEARDISVEVWKEQSPGFDVKKS